MTSFDRHGRSTDLLKLFLIMKNSKCITKNEPRRKRVN